MNFIYGVLGTVLVLAVFGAGFFAGWKTNGKVGAERAEVHAETPSERERRELIEEQKAFQQLLSYNINDAYGLNAPPGAETEDR